MRRLSRAPLVALALAVATIVPGSATADRVASGGDVLDWGSYDAYGVSAASGDTLRITMSSSAALDILLMTPTGFAAYRDSRDASEWYPSGSALAVNHADIVFSIPGGGVYHIVVDNTDLPAGGAASGSQANYTLAADLEMASALVAVCSVVLAVVAVAGVAALVSLSRKGRRGSVTGVAVASRPPLRVCENCGGMTGGVDRCTICGAALPGR